MGAKKQHKHMIDILFVLLLFASFAFSSLLLIVMGSDVYQTTVNRMDANYYARTSCSYIIEKARANDSASSFSILENFGDSDALCLTEEIHETKYHTLIYYHNGQLKELFCKADLQLPPDAGQNILDCEGFAIEPVDDTVFLVSIQEAGCPPLTVYLSNQST